MTIKVERKVYTINRTNNGKIILDKSINNIKWLNVASVFFKHGPKKKTRKTKKRNDDSDDESPYENGNNDLMDSTYISIKINDFEKGILYDNDGLPTKSYTCRIFSDDIDTCTGEYDWYNHNKSTIDGIHDWDSYDNKLKNIEELNVEISTDINQNPVHVNFEIELEFGIAV